MLLVWQGLKRIARGCVPPPQVSPQEGGGVAVVCDVVTIETDLSVTELFCQGQAEVISTTLITDGLGLVRGRRDDDFVAHCALVDCPRILQAAGGHQAVLVDTVPTVHPRLT